jgi:hypothetical protein
LKGNHKDENEAVTQNIPAQGLEAEKARKKAMEDTEWDRYTSVKQDCFDSVRMSPDMACMNMLSLDSTESRITLMV